MNELEFLRSQVRLERVHMRDLRALFSAAEEALRYAGEARVGQ